MVLFLLRSRLIVVNSSLQANPKGSFIVFGEVSNLSDADAEVYVMTREWHVTIWSDSIECELDYSQVV